MRTHSRFFFCVLATLTCLVFAPASLLADTTDTFTISGTFLDGSTLSGTITIDVTTGMIGSNNIVWTGSSTTLGPFNAPPGPAVGMQTGAVVALLNDADNDVLILALDTDNAPNPGTLVGYTGGALCTFSSETTPPDPCTDPFANTVLLPLGAPQLDLQSGSATLTSSVLTPEPSSVLLLGAGLLSLGILRHGQRQFFFKPIGWQ
jgi:PEP-CTERM motif